MPTLRRPPYRTVSTPTVAAAPEAPTKPAEAPVEVPTRQDPVPGDPDQQDEPDIDEQIKRIIREIPDPTPQPGGE